MDIVENMLLGIVHGTSIDYRGHQKLLIFQSAVSWFIYCSTTYVFAEGEPMNWGLHHTLKEKWKKLEELERFGDFTTTYHLGYNRGLLPKFPHRYATPRTLSSHLHPQRINKDLNLRGLHSNVHPEHPITTHRRLLTA